MKRIIATLVGKLFPWLPAEIERQRAEQARDAEIAFQARVRHVNADGAAEKEKAILAGGGTLYPYSNIAHGTWGWALYACEYDGLMSMTTKHERINETMWGYVTRFKLTDKGRSMQQALKALRAAEDAT